MIAFYVLVAVLLVVVLLAVFAAVWVIDSAHRATIQSLRDDNKELRDRLFQSKGFAPSGVNVTEQYLEKKEQQKTETTAPSKRSRKVVGPIEQLTAQWTKKDKKLADKGVQVT